MPRYKILVEYDGTGFVGWQRQKNGLSIQESIETAVEAVVGYDVRIHGAGRTDAGVHARGQVAHFDLNTEFSPDTVRDAINFHLKPAPIAILQARQASDQFHARFDAIERRYKYVINSRRAPLTLDRHHHWHVAVPLDAEQMSEAASLLEGTHDFTTFRAAECQAQSPIKTLTEARVRRWGSAIELSVRAPSFLHHQVRSIAGTLKLVGEGKWHPGDVREALEAKDRSACGPVAPARGLSLEAILYPDDP